MKCLLLALYLILEIVPDLCGQEFGYARYGGKEGGVGRMAAQRLKSSSHIGYQSRGVSLTAERIELLNKDNPNRITMQIGDLEDDRRLALGTRVTISFPIK